ncbi:MULTISPECIES: sulfurtransferase complex subunit TusB [Pseudomonas]|jgi:tRNA 2-thiouridine synthesizing protein B|uniref:sulfurtransferase complex subunit TusB n=1 Tax=Pseudomonas TaxID=286 RepID=UPI001AE5A716|nr:MULTISPECIES: sulfurtransferase complex subunit TusB [unclassified Pseudomonas]MBP1125023.1 tRNA 2-thiouridine synthesizing protein B [Pseudomonas sp. PvP025]MDQ0398883.1 tRNA 2-thiouridine synthesizing protein B [Pseudomonas sp. PvP006]MEB0106219.1 sulfurtransferase complex subunit TusB [Pseudomonas sp. MH9.3]WPX80665.1 sulfurtransferase complex subunit TusB [Pseudomonas sp. MH9.3]
MSTLHVLSHSPFTDSRLDSCLRICGAEDAILLCGDGAYGLQNAALQGKGVKVFVLAEDSQARNLPLPDWADSVDYPGFVQLSVGYDKVNTWL